MMEFEPGKLDIDPDQNSCEAIFKQFGLDKPKDNWTLDERLPEAILHLVWMMDQRHQLIMKKYNEMQQFLVEYDREAERKDKEVETAIHQLQNFMKEQREFNQSKKEEK